MLSEKAERILRDKYYLTGDKHNNKVEDFDSLCIRVANHIASAESDPEDKRYWLSKYYQLMRELWFLPGGRILANAGSRCNGNLFNCFSLDIEDSRNSIYGTLGLAANIFAHGGGVGYNFSKIREHGTPVSNGSYASGPTSFLRLFDYSAGVISQASRRGAQLACLNCDHPDILRFINVKNKEGGLARFNISVGITSEFMRAVNNEEQFSLLSRYYVFEGTKVSAREIYREMATAAWNTGDPGILFLDRLERDNAVPFLGKLDKVNPCLPGDAMLLGGYGPAKIKDLQVGDMVWDGASFVPLVAKWSSGMKKVYEVDTTAGTFRATEDHLVMSRGSKVTLKDAVTLTRIRGASYPVQIHDPIAVLDGLLAGDGCKNGGGGKQMKLIIGDKDHDYFSSEITDYIGAQYSTKAKKVYNVSKYTLTTDEFDVHRVPDRYKYGQPVKVASFLRGLYTANGSICGGVRISLKSTHKSLLRDVQKMLSSLGILSYMTTTKPVEITWSNGTYTSKESYGVEISDYYSVWGFSKMVGFIHKEKTKALTHLVRKDMPKQLTCSSSWGLGRSHYEIKSIRYVGKEEVYDFTVDNQTHNVWVDGFLVSNCSEAPLLSMEACCLGSINLTKMLSYEPSGKLVFDEQKLVYAVSVAVRFLDSIHTVNVPITQKLGDAARRTRKIGLGVMGWADTLAMLEIPYDSDEAIVLADTIGEAMKYTAYTTSVLLAEEKGAYPAFDSIKSRNIWFPNKPVTPTRNAMLLGFAPTGSIALVAGVNSSIEPFFALDYTKRVTAGEGTDVKYEIKESNKFKDSIIPPKTAHEISFEDHIKMQAAWQKNVDGAISKTANLPHDATVEDIESAVWLGWKLGVKGMTVFRDGCRTFQIMCPTGGCET